MIPEDVSESIFYNGMEKAERATDKTPFLVQYLRIRRVARIYFEENIVEPRH